MTDRWKVISDNFRIPFTGFFRVKMINWRRKKVNFLTEFLYEQLGCYILRQE